MNKTIIFDLDGVLIDSEPINIKAAQLALEEFGYALSDSDISYIPGRHSADYMPIIIAEQKLALDTEKVAARCHQLFHELWEDMVTLMPEAKETLSSLQARGCTLALVTSSHQSSVEKFLRIFSFSSIFSVIVTADDVAVRKPHPDPYLKAITKLNQDPRNMLVVEDTAIGVTAAKAAGLLCVAIPNAYTKNQNFSHADEILTSLREVIALS